MGSPLMTPTRTAGGAILLLLLSLRRGQRRPGAEGGGRWWWWCGVDDAAKVTLNMAMAATHGARQLCGVERFIVQRREPGGSWLRLRGAAVEELLDLRPLDRALLC
jgi:hypothetical protein